jgi:hypothetical protein
VVDRVDNKEVYRVDNNKEDDNNDDRTIVDDNNYYIRVAVQGK